MEHFDRVALILEPGEEGTVVGQRGERGGGRQKKEHCVKKGRKEAWRRDVSGTGTNTVLFYFTSK